MTRDTAFKDSMCANQIAVTAQHIEPILLSVVQCEVIGEVIGVCLTRCVCVCIRMFVYACTHVCMCMRAQASC